MDGVEVKRLKRFFKDPNPLFTKWLVEWKEEAERKDTKMKYSYRTALRSLRQYPLPLSSGRGCGILKGFGTALCARLDDHLTRHNEVHGPLPSPGIRRQVEIGGGRGRGTAGRRRSSSRPTRPQPTPTASHQRLESESSPQQSGSSQCSASGRRKSAEYRPKPRSGAFAILVTLWQQEQQPGHSGCLRKSALQEAAQPLCGSSFTLPERGSYYTAWNCVAGLVKRGLLLRQGSPATFSLTSAGRRLSDSLQVTTAAPGPRSLQTTPADPSPADLPTTSTDAMPLASPLAGSNVRATSSVAAAHGGPAAVDGWRIGSSSAIEGHDRPPLPGAGTSGAQLHLKYQFMSPDGATVAGKSEAAVLVEDNFVGFLALCRQSDLLASGITHRPHRKCELQEGLVRAFLVDSVCADVCPGLDPDSKAPDAVPATVVLQPHTFDVVLCVDNQETSGRSALGTCHRTSRDVILEELSKHAVPMEVRQLAVGDFLWVVRPRGGVQTEELVLPYVVERKRLDDLASSIRGSRYHEQKFRLKRCGLPRVIYLAESMGCGPRVQSAGLPEPTLQQALVNCQVVDGFQVKRTADQRETAAFLGLMTRRLQQQYQPLRLESCSRDQLPAVAPSVRLQLFSEFNRMSTKRQRLTAADLLAKMLLQLSGMSADRTAAVVATHATVRRLLDAYSACPPGEREALLAPLRTGRSGRQLGIAISRAVHHLYCDSQLY